MSAFQILLAISWAVAILCRPIPFLPDETPFLSALEELTTKSISQNDLKSLKILISLQSSFNDIITPSHFFQAIKDSHDLTLLLLLKSKSVTYTISAYSLIREAMAAKRCTSILVAMVSMTQCKGSLVPNWDTVIHETDIHRNWKISREFSEKVAVAARYIDYKAAGKYIKWGLKNETRSNHGDPISNIIDESKSLRAYLKETLMSAISSGNFKFVKKLVTPAVMKPYLFTALLHSLRYKNKDMIKLLSESVNLSTRHYKAARLANKLRLPLYIASLCLTGRHSNLSEAIKKAIQKGDTKYFQKLAKAYQPPPIEHGKKYDEITGLYESSMWSKPNQSATSNFIEFIPLALNSPQKSIILPCLLQEHWPFVKGVAPVTKMRKYSDLISLAHRASNIDARNNLIVLALRAYKNISMEADYDFEFPCLANLLNSCIFIGDALRNVPGMNYDVSCLILNNLCEKLFSSSPNDTDDYQCFQDLTITSIDVPQAISDSSSSSSEDDSLLIENEKFALKLNIQGIYKENMQLR